MERLGRRSVGLKPLLDVSSMGPNPTEVAQICSTVRQTWQVVIELGRNRPTVGRFLAKLGELSAEFAPHLADSGPAPTTSGRVWAICLPKSGRERSRSRATCCLCRPKLAHIWSIVVQFWPISVEFAPALAEVCPTSAAFSLSSANISGSDAGPRPGQTWGNWERHWLELARSRPNIGRHRPQLANFGRVG